jgi:predicted transcriptional regulator
MPDDPTVVERAVVVQLLDRKQAATPDELYAEISDSITPADIDAAIRSLAEKGVIHRDPDRALRASAVLQHLDTLGLICV